MGVEQTTSEERRVQPLESSFSFSAVVVIVVECSVGHWCFVRSFAKIVVTEKHFSLHRLLPALLEMCPRPAKQAEEHSNAAVPTIHGIGTEVGYKWHHLMRDPFLPYWKYPQSQRASAYPHSIGTALIPPNKVISLFHYFCRQLTVRSNVCS